MEPPARRVDSIVLASIVPFFLEWTLCPFSGWSAPYSVSGSVRLSAPPDQVDSGRGRSLGRFSSRGLASFEFWSSSSKHRPHESRNLAPELGHSPTENYCK